jgi:hypothetical protein
MVSESTVSCITVADDLPRWEAAGELATPRD